MAISASSLSLALLLLLWPPSFPAVVARVEHEFCAAPLVTREERKTVASSDYGSVSAVDVDDGFRGKYHLQFFALEPQSLLVPLHLHSDMVFYVHSGRGTISWTSDGETVDLDVEKGDIYRIGSGSVFYVRSNPDPLRQKLRIHAIFTTPTSDSPADPFAGVYSNLADLIRGFDEQVLRMGFRVSEEVISALKSGERPPFIVPFTGEKEREAPGWKEGIFEALIGVGRPLGGDNGKKKKEKEEKKKTKGKAFNILDAEPDVENCNGRSIAITDKELRALKGSDVGVFMVNLTKGSMMGPHWNPRATEIAIVTAGEGMVQVVLPRVASFGVEEAAECTSWRFRVSEGDVFVVPKYHAMAQMSFNNGSLSFVGFSSSVRKNRPQFLAGKRSVLQTLDRDILALSLGVANKTVVEKLLEPQGEAIMLDCTSCAEEAERVAEEMAKKRRREEEEREERKREEEEEERREEEKEEQRRKEEEEARREEEKEEQRRKEEEEARRREEEEEEQRRKEEEEMRRREEEEEEQRRKEEEEMRRREEEKEEERRRREEEEEERRRKEKEERREKEEEARREQEEEERGEEEEEATRKEEEARREQEEQERREEEEEATRKEEEARREQEEEERRAEEEQRRREQEEGQEEREGRREEEEETPS